MKQAVIAFMAICSSSLGLFLFLRPVLAIEIQKRFYEKINWRIEPISMPKEIHNTKSMGLWLFFASLMIGAYYLIGECIWPVS